jgi:hypothetical protein
MPKNIALIGLPVANHFVINSDGDVEDYYPVSSPGFTAKTLELLTEESERQGLVVSANEEIVLPERDVSIEDLLTAGAYIKQKTKDADRVICFGPSHFGAIAFYNGNEKVARFDCHGDYFSEKNLKPHESFPGSSYASYMNAVEKRLRRVKVINYGVLKMELLGERGVEAEKKYLAANHFDIDMDVFTADLKMNNEPCKSYYKPQELLEILAEAKPRKIGIWEYRSHEDLEGNALKFLLSALSVPFKGK